MNQEPPEDYHALHQRVQSALAHPCIGENDKRDLRYLYGSMLMMAAAVKLLLDDVGA